GASATPRLLASPLALAWITAGVCAFRLTRTETIARPMMPLTTVTSASENLPMGTSVEDAAESRVVRDADRDACAGHWSHGSADHVGQAGRAGADHLGRIGTLADQDRDNRQADDGGERSGD